MPGWLLFMFVLLGLLGLIVPLSQARVHFAFREESQALKPSADGNSKIVEITGYIQNKSTRLKYVAKLYLVVWLPNHRDTKLFLTDPIRIQDDTGKVGPHLEFKDGEERRFILECDLPSDFADATYTYEILILTSAGKLFDQRGKLINSKNIERRRELAKRIRANVDDGAGERVHLLRMKIRLCDAGFAVRRVFWFLLGV